MSDAELEELKARWCQVFAAHEALRALTSERIAALRPKMLNVALGAALNAAMVGVLVWIWLQGGSDWLLLCAILSGMVCAFALRAIGAECWAWVHAFRIMGLMRRQLREISDQAQRGAMR